MDGSLSGIDLVQMECAVYLHVTPKEDQYRLSDFTFEHMNIRTQQTGGSYDTFRNVRVEDVNVTVTEE